MDSSQDPELQELKQNISRLLMSCKNDQEVTSAINWLIQIVCQFKAKNNIVFNNDEFNEDMSFSKDFLRLVNLEYPNTILKAIPWIDLKLCEARVKNTVDLDDGNSMMDPVWLQKWKDFEQNPAKEPDFDQKWTNCVLTLTNTLLDSGDDLPEVIEWLERKVAAYKIGGGSFDGTNQTVSERLEKFERAFSSLVESISPHLLMVFMLWVDLKLAENTISNEFTFDSEVPVYDPQWLRTILGTTLPPSPHYDYLSPTLQRDYFDLDMPIQKLSVLTQSISQKDARSLGLINPGEPMSITIKLNPNSHLPVPIPSFTTVVEPLKDSKNKIREEYVCPHCSAKMTMAELNQHLDQNKIPYEWLQMGDKMSLIITEDSDGEDKKEIPVFQVSTQTTFKLERHLFPPLKKITPAVPAKAFDGRRVVSESVLKKLEKARSMRRFGKRRKLSSEEEEDAEYGTVMTPGVEEDEELSPIPSNKSHLKALKAVSRGTRSRPSRGIPKFASSEEEEEDEKKERRRKDSDSSVSIEVSSESSESIDERPRRKRRGRVEEKVVETEDGTYPCPYCEDKFDEPGVLGEHLFDHVYPNKRKVADS